MEHALFIEIQFALIFWFSLAVLQNRQGLNTNNDNCALRSLDNTLLRQFLPFHDPATGISSQNGTRSFIWSVYISSHRNSYLCFYVNKKKIVKITFTDACKHGYRKVTQGRFKALFHLSRITSAQGPKISRLVLQVQ